MTELEALVVLNNILYLGTRRCQTLIKYFESAVNILNATPEALQKAGINNAQTVNNITCWRSNLQWRRDLELVDKGSIDLISFSDERYPRNLLNIEDRPTLLYVKGTLTPEDTNSIAIVGTRQPSQYGKRMAAKMAAGLAEAGIVVVSGLARGIDTIAHQAALQKGRTIAVIGSGLGKVYPPENRQLAETIARQGAVISEYPMATEPERQHFPQRNRIVSGMTRGSMLIEAPEISGSMITMKQARKQAKQCYTIPGAADNENFRGNHKLIKNGQAMLIEDSKDVIESMETLWTVQAR